MQEQTRVTVKDSGRQGAVGGNGEWGQVDREDGLKGRRREKSHQPPQGHIASSPGAEAVPSPSHLWVLSLGVPTSQILLLGFLSSAAHECYLYPTSPAECLALPPSTPLEASGSPQACLAPSTSWILQLWQDIREWQALGRAGLSEWHVHSLRAALP